MASPLLLLSQGGISPPFVAKATPKAVVHLAALVSVPQSIEEPALNFRLNVAATQHLIEALRVARARRDQGPI